MKKEKIVLGMSGGVDSSVAAFLLQNKGFEVHGIFMKNWDDKNAICNAEDDYADALNVCNQLNISLKKINYTKEYKERVFSQFLDDHKNGLTPNPDVLCNKEIKFDVFQKYAKEIGASKIMQDRALNNPKISVMWNSEIVEMYGDPKDKGLESVDIRNLQSGEVVRHNTDGVFMAIGHKPNSDIFKDQLSLNESGYIITEADSTVTSVEGVFAAGDIQDFTYKQAITAAGSGCMAAIEAERFLEGH